MYEKQQWTKVLANIHKKAELDKSREFANQIMTRFQHLEKDRARKEREAARKTSAASATATNEKQKTVVGGAVKKEPSSSLNAGIKRTIDEVGKGTTTNAAKKMSLGDVRNSIPNSNPPKTAAPSVPARNGPSASSVGDKKSTSSVGTSTGPAAITASSAAPTVAAKPKPPANSGFFKALGKTAEPAKAQSKFVFPGPMMIREKYWCLRIVEADSDHVTGLPRKRRPSPPPPRNNPRRSRVSLLNFSKGRKSRIVQRRMPPRRLLMRPE
jgi:hypothetical protein